jgi:hypothetical protein
VESSIGAHVLSAGRIRGSTPSIRVSSNQHSMWSFFCFDVLKVTPSLLASRIAGSQAEIGLPAMSG